MATNYDKFVQKTFAERPELARAWEQKSPLREIAIALTKLRRDAGLTQRQVAEKAGWKQPYVARLESGLDHMPSPETVARFAEVCNAEAGLILIRKGPSGVEISDTISLTGRRTAVERIMHIAEQDQEAVTEQFVTDAVAVGEKI